MTVAEATVIADNALEHTVRTILASLQAPEILKSTAGNAVHCAGTVVWLALAATCTDRPYVQFICMNTSTEYLFCINAIASLCSGQTLS